MLAQLEDLTVVGPLPFEYRGRIMEGVGENVDVRFAPRHQFAIEPDPAVAIVERALVFRHLEPLCLGFR